MDLNVLLYRRRRAVAHFALLLIGVWIFSPYISGRYTFIGDSDRLNHTLSLLNIDVQNIRNGTWSSWSESLFGGHTLVAWPYYYRSPFPYLALLWSERNLFDAAAVISALLVIVAGWSAFGLVQRLYDSTFLAFVAGALYQTSALVVLKISQDFVTVSGMCLYALGLLIIHDIRPGGLAKRFGLLSLVIIGIVEFTFLQNAAYIMPALGAYAAYRTFYAKNFYTLPVFAASSLVAASAFLPWIYGVFTEFRLTFRNYGAGKANDFETVYQSQGFQTGQLLRWLDDRIFGKSLAEAISFNNSINLHEGMLNYTTTFCAVIILLGICLHSGTIFKTTLARRDSPYFIAIFVTCLLLVTTRFGHWIMFEVYFKIDLIHDRILLIAILPGIVTAIAFLHYWTFGDARSSSHQVPVRDFVAACVLALTLVAATETIAAMYNGRFYTIDWQNLISPRGISSTATIRIAISIFLTILAFGAIKYFSNDKPAKFLACYVLGILSVSQGLMFAREEISGDQMIVSGRPFNSQNASRVKASADEFRLPSGAALTAFHKRLETGSYRTSLVCAPDVTYMLCSPHVAAFWRWRVIEGYLFGVPSRLAALPWPKDTLGTRQINFTRSQDLGWPLLALLNVKYAVRVSSGLMTNQILDSGKSREINPDDVEILVNPRPVVPRFFFTRQVTPVSSVEEGVSALFSKPEGLSNPLSVTIESFVEGYSKGRSFDSNGKIEVEFMGDKINIKLDPTDEPRFLVLNERYHPDWHAYAGAIELPVYPTNVYMRGVEVPRGVGSVVLRYKPFVESNVSLLFYSFSAVGLFLGLLYLRRRDRRH